MDILPMLLLVTLWMETQTQTQEECAVTFLKVENTRGEKDFYYELDITTLEACRDLCINDPGCWGFHFVNQVDPNALYTVPKCARYVNKNVALSARADGVDHYIRKWCGDEPTTIAATATTTISSATTEECKPWIAYTGMNSTTGTLQPDLKLLIACRDECGIKAQCTAFDFNVLNNDCFHLDKQVSASDLTPDTNVDHHTKSECFNDTTRATPTGDDDAPGGDSSLQSVIEIVTIVSSVGLAIVVMILALAVIVKCRSSRLKREQAVKGDAEFEGQIDSHSLDTISVDSDKDIPQRGLTPLDVPSHGRKKSSARKYTPGIDGGLKSNTSRNTLRSFIVSTSSRKKKPAERQAGVSRDVTEGREAPHTSKERKPIFTPTVKSPNYGHPPQSERAVLEPAKLPKGGHEKRVSKARQDSTVTDASGVVVSASPRDISTGRKLSTRDSAERRASRIPGDVSERRPSRIPEERRASRAPTTSGHGQERRRSQSPTRNRSKRRSMAARPPEEKRLSATPRDINAKRPSSSRRESAMEPRSDSRRRSSSRREDHPAYQPSTRDGGQHSPHRRSTRDHH